MPVRKIYNFAIDDDLADGLRRLKVRDGVAESETIRRALRIWLERKGILKKGAKPKTT